MGDSNCIINAIIIGIVISLVMPKLVLSFAKPDEIKLPQNLDNASMKHKFMHLMAHKEKMPLLTVLIVSFVIGISMYVGYMVDPMKYLKK